jgi:hypothetical protein
MHGATIKIIIAELIDATTCKAINVTCMKKQFVVTHAIRPTEIPALLDSWAQTHLSKCCFHKKIASPYVFVKHNIFKCWAIMDVSSFVSLSYIMCISLSWAIFFSTVLCIYITPLEGWSAHRRDLYLTTQGTDIYTPSEIRTHNPSKRAAADPRLRPRGHWHRHRITY